jgi:hypothetical protein
LAWQTWHTQPYDGWRWQNVVAGFSAAWQVQPNVLNLTQPFLYVSELIGKKYFKPGRVLDTDY